MAVDDCSSDSTEAILKNNQLRDPRIHALRSRRNNGAGVARNLALLRSSGDYIAFLDSDDAFLFCKMKLQLSEMLRLRSDSSFTAYKVKSPELSRYRHGRDICKEAQILRKCKVGCSTVMHKRQEPPILMDRIKRRQDFCYWVKLIRSGHRLSYIKIPLSIYHVGRKSLSSSKPKSAIYQWIAYRRYIRLGWLQSVGYMLCYMTLNLHQRLCERLPWGHNRGDF